MLGKMILCFTVRMCGWLGIACFLMPVLPFNMLCQFFNFLLSVCCNLGSSTPFQTKLPALLFQLSLLGFFIEQEHSLNESGIYINWLQNKLNVLWFLGILLPSFKIIIDPVESGSLGISISW